MAFIPASLITLVAIIAWKLRQTSACISRSFDIKSWKKRFVWSMKLQPETMAMAAPTTLRRWLLDLGEKSSVSQPEIHPHHSGSNGPTNSKPSPAIFHVRLPSTCCRHLSRFLAIVAVSALCSATITVFIYYLFLLPFVHEFGAFVDVRNGPDVARPTGSRQFPCRLKTRCLREDCRVRQRVYLVIQPILKDHLFTPELI